MNCKNCKMTDEYCASGDCPNDTLTEQWRKSELPEEWYYLKVNEELANCPVISECVVDYNLGLPISYFYDFDVAKIEQVLAPVPSYSEWKASEKRNTQLKELLKEIRSKIKTVYDMDYMEFITSAEFDDAFVKKIDEVLR